MTYLVTEKYFLLSLPGRVIIMFTESKYSQIKIHELKGDKYKVFNVVIVKNCYA